MDFAGLKRKGRDAKESGPSSRDCMRREEAPDKTITLHRGRKRHNANRIQAHAAFYLYVIRLLYILVILRS
jgi:hypothetical protein